MPTANMSLTLPTNHGSADVWDTILEDLFTLIDEHDHTTGKGVAIPAAALNINADVPWNSGGTYRAITGIKALDFQPSDDAAMTSYACALFVDDSNNELYWRTSGGVNVKLTAASALNVAAFTGGLGGDYASISALLDYDDASDTYRFRQELSGGVRQYAKIGVADIVLREYDPAGDATVPVETVTLKSPDALAASYGITMPAALPGSQAVVQMSSTGQLIASNTRANKTLVIGPANYMEETANAYAGAGKPYFQYNTGYYPNTSTARIVVPINLDPGDVITDCKLWLHKGSGSGVTVFAQLWKIAFADGTRTAIDSNTNSLNAPGASSIQVASGGVGSLSETVAATHYYQLEIYQTGAASAADYLRSTVITYDKAL